MKTQKGITLIALIITIIVMLILVGVSVSVALNTGLFKTAQGVAKNTQIAAEEENLLSTGIITIRNSTTGKLEQVDINSFAGKKEEPVEELLDINEALSDKAAIGTKVNYSAGGVTDWRIYEKDETAETVTILGKAIIGENNIITEEQLNSYVETQYIDPNHEEKIESISIIKASDVIDLERFDDLSWELGEPTTQEAEFISLFGLENSYIYDKFRDWSDGYGEFYGDGIWIDGNMLRYLEDMQWGLYYDVLIRC